MRTNIGLFALSVIGAGLLVAGAARADTKLVTNQLNKWKLDGPAANPLPVAAKKGDVIEFRVTGSHGVVTIDKPGNQAPSPALTLVLVCGEDAASKPNHVLREVECGANSQFNQVLKAPMKLELTDKFQDDVHFWCIFHTAGMWGTIKLAP